jgi:hypothetical protein
VLCKLRHARSLSRARATKSHQGPIGEGG